jgi:hypothetical protein
MLLEKELECGSLHHGLTQFKYIIFKYFQYKIIKNFQNYEKKFRILYSKFQESIEKIL